MNKPTSGKTPKSLSGEVFRKHLKEAELYATQGLFDEAREIYESLAHQIHSWMMNATGEGKQVGQNARKALKLLEERLAELESRVDAFEKERVHLDLEIFRQNLKDADVYIIHGLFDEARGIYEFLILQIRSWMKYTASQGIQVGQSAYRALKILEKRLTELQRQVEIFNKKRVSEEMAHWDRTKKDEEAIFYVALALKGTDLTAEAIEDIGHVEEVDDTVAQSYIEIADFLIQKRESGRGIKILKQLLDVEHIETTVRIGILQKMASAYESTGDRKRAIESYQELIAYDKLNTEASQKIVTLTKELRKIRLSIATVTQYPKIFFIASFLIAIFFMAFMPFAKTVNNVDYFTIENDPDIEYYDNFKEIFGNDEFFIIAFEKDDIFTEDTLTLLTDITRDLEEIEEIEEVTSLANVDDIVGEKEYFEARKFLEEIPDDPAELKGLKDQAVNNNLYVNNLISKDAKTASIVVKTFDRPEDEDYRKRLLEKTEAVLEGYRNKVDAFHLSGWTSTNLSLSQCMKTDVATFIPVTYLFITIAIWLVFRNLILTALAIANISVCAGSVLGLFGLTGITLNNVTVIIPSMVMALALCDTVHIFSHMDKRILDQTGDRREALASVLKQVIFPSFLTTLTTAIGFLSLAVSEISPIKDFAWIASAGMLFEFFYSFFLLPPLLLLFKPEKIYQEYQAQRGITLFLQTLYDLVNRRRWAVAISGCIVILTAVWFSSRVKVETNLIGFFKESSSLRQSLDYVEKRLGGVDSLDISLKAETEDAFKDPKNLKIIEEIQQYAANLKGVDHTVSFVDFIKDMNESFHEENHRYYSIPESRDMVAQYLLLYDSEDIEDVINNTYDHARIAIRISEHRSSKQASLINDIREFIDSIVHTGLEIRITGRALKDVNTIDALVKGQVYSLALATAIISFIMFLALRSISIGILSFIPNLFPIILNFGIMGAMGIPLDTGTALIAAVAIGIAVDDTIHFLSEYRDKRGQGTSIPTAVKTVMFLKGRPIFSSSIILCIGFGVLILSSFTPTLNFGMLTAIIMMTAVIGDIVFLPAIIMLKK